MKIGSTISELEEKPGGGTICPLPTSGTNSVKAHFNQLCPVPKKNSDLYPLFVSSGLSKVHIEPVNSNVTLVKECIRRDVPVVVFDK